MPTYKQMEVAALRNVGPLKIQGLKKPSVRGVVHQFLISRKATYNKNGFTQCGSHASRSRHDFFLVMKTYFPNITYEICSKIYTGLAKANITYVWFCGVVGRGVCAPRKLTTTREQVGKVIDKLNLPVKSRNLSTKN
jgi:hypothetical protein